MDERVLCYINSHGYKVCTNKDYDFDFSLDDFDIDEGDLNKSLNERDRIINGYASTEDKDLDGEIILSKGLDIDPFLKYGFFNYDHEPGIDNLIGVPTRRTEVKHNGLSVEGILFKGQEFPRAEQTWKLAKFLKKAELPVKRNLGYSIQGKYIKRDPSNNKRVIKALVNHIAVTHKPINRETFKSFSFFEKSLKEIMKSGEINDNDADKIVIENEVTDDDIYEIQERLNNRPRKYLGFQTPSMLFLNNRRCT